MKELICITCPRGCHLTVDEENGYAVSGNLCKRGEVYGKAEVTNPVRVVTSTVAVYPAFQHPGSPKTKHQPLRCPVKTSQPIPKALIFDAMKEIEASGVTLPVKIGDIIIRNIAGSNADLIATKNLG